MSKQCPPHQILNPVSNRCVNKDGAIGKKLLENSKVNTNGNTNDCPPGKIRNPASNRCVDINGAIGKKVLRDMNIPVSKQTTTSEKPSTSTEPFITQQSKIDNKYSLYDKGISNKKCLEKVNYRIHQGKCPICWIASAIVAIKFSNIHKYMTVEYKKVVNDAYNIFSGKSPNPDKCPHIPKKVTDKYIEIFEQKNGPLSAENRKNLLNFAGATHPFIVSLLSVGLKANYGTILTTKINTRYEQNIIVIDGEPLIKYVDLNDANLLVNVLNKFKFKFLGLGYMFTSGTLLTSLKPDDNHAIAFTVCDNKYYACNSYDTECVEIKNTNIFARYITPLKRVISITFILIPN